MAASKAILFEHDTLLIRPEQDQLLENLVHMVNTKYIKYYENYLLFKIFFLFRLLIKIIHWDYQNFVQLKMFLKLIAVFYLPI